MDITSSLVMWLGGRCHRINPTTDKMNVEAPQPPGAASQLGAYIEEDLYQQDEDEQSTIDYEVEFESGKFRSSFNVPDVFMGRIIGPRGTVKSRLEHETHTKITVPKQGLGGSVVVTGLSKDNVVRARQRIDMITIAARKRARATHFTSVSLAKAGIQEQYLKFKEKVLDMRVPDIDATWFTKPAKLHVTMNVMTLVDNNDRQRAQDLLAEFQKSFLATKGNRFRNIPVKVAGVGTFNDSNLAKCRVVYAVVESEILQELADALYRFYIKHELSFAGKDCDKVTMHMTLLKSENRDRFDATSIVNQLESFVFGETTINEIYLSQISSEDPETGYYKSTMVIQL